MPQGNPTSRVPAATKFINEAPIGLTDRQTLASYQHGPERMPAEQVHMEMRHFLVPVPPDIGEQAITGLDQPLLARDMADRAHETCDFFRAGPG